MTKRDADRSCRTHRVTVSQNACVLQVSSPPRSHSALLRWGLIVKGHDLGGSAGAGAGAGSVAPHHQAEFL